MKKCKFLLSKRYIIWKTEVLPKVLIYLNRNAFGKLGAAKNLGNLSMD